MSKYDKLKYQIDFSKNDKLSKDQKKALKAIQELYLPIERATFLAEYRDQGLISDDEFSELTGIPYSFGDF